MTKRGIDIERRTRIYSATGEREGFRVVNSNNNNKLQQVPATLTSNIKDFLSLCAQALKQNPLAHNTEMEKAPLVNW
jgi:hypothetical protein